MENRLGLIALLMWPAVLTAQNGVTVSGFAINAGTLTFNVNWNNTGMPAAWSDTVWVFVDYNKAGTMERLPLSTGATLTATSAPGMGKVMEEPGNNKGIWVVGNARSAGNFSATVRLLTTANVGGTCVYASNYPPVGKYTSASNILFTGTSPYNIVIEKLGGSTSTVTADSSYNIPSGFTVKSFTDKTSAPGIIRCILMTGTIDFSVAPTSVVKGQAISFAVNAALSAPVSSAVMYNWSAPGFVPATYTGTSFSATAPTTASTYPVTLMARSSGYCDLTKTKDVSVISCANPATFTLTASSSLICGGQSVTLTAVAGGGTTGVGAVYEWGTGAVGSNLLSPATTTANTYSVSPNAATTYWVRLRGTGACSATTTGGVTTAIAIYPAVSPGTIISGSKTTSPGTSPNVTTQNSTDATGGSGSITCEWRRSGTSSKTLDGSNATTYSIGSDASNYATAGTYYFNRYAKDATCNTAWVAASGTYTLTVIKPGPSGNTPNTLCDGCCYDGSSWVNCYVTTNAYPFNSSSSNTTVKWSGNDKAYYSGANSAMDGRRNTAAISSGGESAVQACKDLGNGWYLPAYEELVKMVGTLSFNNGPSNSYWSSTEYYGNDGRYNSKATNFQTATVLVATNGALSYDLKAYNHYVRCVWRN